MKRKTIWDALRPEQQSFLIALSSGGIQEERTLPEIPYSDAIELTFLDFAITSGTKWAITDDGRLAIVLAKDAPP